MKLSRLTWALLVLAVALAAAAAVMQVRIRHCQQDLDRLVTLDRTLDDIVLTAASGGPGWRAAVNRRMLAARRDGAALPPAVDARLAAVLAALERDRTTTGDGAALEHLRRAVDELQSVAGDRLVDRVARLDRLLGSFATVLAALTTLALVAGVAVPRWLTRSRAQVTMQHQNDLLAAAVRSADEGIMVSTFGASDESPRIEFVNDAFARMCDRAPDELVGRPLAEVEGHRIGHGAGELGHSVSDGRSTRLETAIERPDGSREYWEWHVSPVRDRSGEITHFVSSLRDITRRRRYEEELRRTADALTAANRELREHHAQLVQSEKMASLGQLAAGVAHEINNPIGYVRTNVDLLEQDLRAVRGLLDCLLDLAGAVAAGDGGAARQAVATADEIADRDNVPALLEELDPMLADIRDGLDRVHEIVSDLRDFARPSESEPEPTDVNHQLEVALKIAHNALKYRCEVVTELGELPTIISQPGQLSQVFTNLLVNAADAIADRGTITATTAADADWITVQVTDTGCGIEREHLAEIFSPFFTTKPVGQGTGLGLAVSYGIVTRLGGTITVESTPGVGSTFTVRLPVR